MRAFVWLIGSVFFACGTTSNGGPAVEGTQAASQQGSTTSPGSPSIPRCNELRANLAWTQAPVPAGLQQLYTPAQGFVAPPDGWTPPPGVELRMIGAPEIAEERVRLRAELVNTTSTPQNVYLWRAPGVPPFYFHLVGDGITELPIDPSMQHPAAMPAPMLVVLPAGARWEHRAERPLPCHTYRPGQAAKVRWSFSMGSGGRQGEIPITLSSAQGSGAPRGEGAAASRAQGVVASRAEGAPSPEARAARCDAIRQRPPWPNAEIDPPAGLLYSNQFDRRPGAPAFVPPPDGWAPPAGVEFRLIGAPQVEAERIVVRGELVNTTSSPQQVYLWSGRRGHFHVYLIGDGVVERRVDPSTQPPEVHPAPSLYVLPAGARWEVQREVILPCHTYTPGQAAKLAWHYTMGSGVHGEIPISLR